VIDDPTSRVRAWCAGLPEVEEQAAWTGTRWRVRGRTFAAVLLVADGWPPVYARAAGTDGPAWVLTFRSAGEELDALRRGGPPFFAPPWRADEVGVVLDEAADWDDLAELVAESWWLQAPKRLRPQRN
jgi:hypothetical protein